MLFVPPKSHSKIGNFTEDDITSTIFGPLDFMHSGDAWKCVCIAGLIPAHEEHPVSHSIKLWPTYKRVESEAFDWQRKTPDFVAEFIFSSGRKIWLSVEVKWKSPESGKAQLAKQSEAIAPMAKKHDAELYQAALTFHPGAAQEMIASSLQIANELNARWWKSSNTSASSWSQLFTRLESKTNTPAVERWCGAVRTFLIALNVTPFSGLPELPMTNLSFNFNENFEWGGVEGITEYSLGDKQ